MRVRDALGVIAQRMADGLGQSRQREGKTMCSMMAMALGAVTMGAVVLLVGMRVDVHQLHRLRTGYLIRAGGGIGHRQYQEHCDQQCDQ